MTTTLRALLLLPLLTSGLLAQRTWIVDAAGGPGVDFTDIQPGVDAARDGDTLLVRSGSYAGFRVAGKGLSILGAAGVQIPGMASVRVEATTAAQAVTLSDLQLNGNGVVFVPSGVFGCLGPVLLERVRIGIFQFGFVVDGAADVRLSECDFQAGLAIQNSQAVLTDGSFAYNRMTISPPVAFAVAGSAVTLSRCAVSGQSAFNRATASAAMSIDAGSVVTVTDDGSHVIGAGTGGVGPLPAIVGTGRLVRDPRVRVIGSNGAGGVAGPTEQIRSIATLQALGAAPGGHVDVDLAGASNEVFALVVGLRGAPLPIPELGGSLGVTNFFLVSAGVFGPSPFHLTIPVGPGMAPGTVLCWQAVAGDGVAVWQLSNAATYVRPR